MNEFRANSTFASFKCWVHSVRAQQSVDGYKHSTVMRFPADYSNSFQMVRLSILINWPQAAVHRPYEVQDVFAHTLRQSQIDDTTKQPPARLEILFAEQQVQFKPFNSCGIFFWFLRPVTFSHVVLRWLIAPYFHLCCISASSWLRQLLSYAFAHIKCLWFFASLRLGAVSYIILW